MLFKGKAGQTASLDIKVTAVKKKSRPLLGKARSASQAMDFTLWRFGIHTWMRDERKDKSVTPCRPKAFGPGNAARARVLFYDQNAFEKVAAGELFEAATSSVHFVSLPAKSNFHHTDEPAVRCVVRGEHDIST